MNREETERLVQAEYSKRYPAWPLIHVSEVTFDTFGGNLAVVAGKDESGAAVEEVCFAYPDKTVRIFSTTNELARFLEMRSKAPLVDKLFSRPLLSGLVFVVLLLFVFIIGFLPTGEYNPQALAVLGSVVGLAAGYFFGSSPKP